MGRVGAALLLVLFGSPSPAAAVSVERWSSFTAEAARRFGIPEAWVRRVMRAESGGRTSLHGRPIVSHAGAMGLMQLMPGTWREMRSAYGLGIDPHDPRDNILAGTAYLRAMYVRFGYPGLFAAYNAGPARYAAHLRTGRKLPAETIAYVADVAGPERSPSAARLALSAPPVAAPAPPPPSAASMFVVRADPAPSDPGKLTGDAPLPASLFVPLRGVTSR
jgi:soluble lytic murein transglycosylase-like protein